MTPAARPARRPRAEAPPDGPGGPQQGGLAAVGPHAPGVIGPHAAGGVGPHAAGGVGPHAAGAADELAALLASHVDRLGQALPALRAAAPTLARWGTELGRRLVAGHRLLAAGNGGSAAEA